MRIPLPTVTGTLVAVVPVAGSPVEAVPVSAALSAAEAAAWPVPARARRRAVICRSGDGTVTAFADLCPHWRVPLSPAHITPCDGAHVRCSGHGALFDPRTGLCVAGPCEGDRLVPLRVEAEGATARVFAQGFAAAGAAAPGSAALLLALALGAAGACNRGPATDGERAAEGARAGESAAGAAHGSGEGSPPSPAPSTAGADADGSAAAPTATAPPAAVAPAVAAPPPLVALMRRVGFDDASPANLHDFAHLPPGATGEAGSFERDGATVRIAAFAYPNPRFAAPHVRDIRERRTVLPQPREAVAAADRFVVHVVAADLATADAVAESIRVALGWPLTPDAATPPDAVTPPP